MSSAQEQLVQEALREESRPIILTRTRWTLYISIAALVLSALSDFRLGPTPPFELIGLKLAEALVQGAAVVLLVLARRSGWTWSIAVTLLGWTLACLATTINGLYTADPILPALLLPVTVLGCAIVLPWGIAPQIALAVVAALMLVPDVSAMGTNLAISVYSMLACSIYLAAAFAGRQRERKALELLQAGQQRVLEHIAAAAPLTEVCSALLRTMHQQAPELGWALMLLDEDAQRLSCAAAAGLPAPYRAAIDGVAIATGREACAVAARSAQRAIAADLTGDPTWSDVPALAAAYGLRSSWCEPVLSTDRSVLGVVAVYGRKPGSPSASALELLASTARLLSIAVERCNARAQLECTMHELEDGRLHAEQQAQRLQVQAVELAEARDQALASMRTRAQFLANMSHEIRTPLNGVIGTVEILLDSDLNPEQREFARILSQSGEHLLAVVNDILDLSRIEAGRVDIEHIEMDLRELVEEVADVLATPAQQKGLELATAIPPELDTRVKGDPSRLRQVLVNLVGNAIKFTERGEIVIEARALAAGDTHLNVRLAVRDTGIGIPADRQAAVFESFTQADGSTTRTHGGTGLGLTISKQLVYLMGGTIGLQSTPGEGSTFWIDLSFERAGDTSAMHRAVPAQLADLNVLVVDDTAINRRILRRTLEAWGCRVAEASGGREALARLEASAHEDRFGLVLLDLHMPDLDGIETARRVQSQQSLAYLPIILLSSVGGLPAGDSAAREVRFAAVVAKPVRQEVLLDRILRAVSHAVPAPEERPPAAAAVAGDALALRVLLAEDNRVNQIVAQRLLEKLGCQLDIVANGRDAAQAAVRSRYDVVLMDVQMPVMDGLAATAAIRQSERANERMRIIAMTAHAMEGDRERCLAAGMDDYITKPLSLIAVREALLRVPRAVTAGSAAPATALRATPGAGMAPARSA